MSRKLLYSQESFILKDNSVSKKTIETVMYLDINFVYLNKLKKNEIDIDLLKKITECCDFVIIEFYGKTNIKIKCKIKYLENFEKIIGKEWSLKESIIKLDSNTVGKLKNKLYEKAKKNNFKY